MPDSPGLIEARKRHNAALDETRPPRGTPEERAYDRRLTKLKAHVTRLVREGKGQDVMTGGIRGPTNLTPRPGESIRDAAARNQAIKDSIRRANP